MGQAIWRQMDPLVHVPEYRPHLFHNLDDGNTSADPLTSRLSNDHISSRRKSIMLNLLFPVFGYLSGSLPFSIWVTRFVKNVDVRDVGSGHATTTNTVRQAGFGWGPKKILDIAKGFIPTFLH
jgi:hypothetical protein